MQQHPRANPRSAGSGSPQPNNARRNSQRDQLSDRGSDFESITYSDRLTGEGSGLRPSPPSERAGDLGKDGAKLKQITQRFFTKAALTILSSRVDLPQSFLRDSNQVRINKWFNLILDESEQLADELAEWATAEVLENRPNPLIIEVYLDTAELARNRTLVVVDERGNKWDVCKALESPATSSAGRSNVKKNSQIVLERWKLYLGNSGHGGGISAADSPPNVYKKAVVLFRALYTYLHLMPAWKFGRRIAKEPATLTALRPLYRVLNAESSTRDSLSTALYPTADPVTEIHDFNPAKCPTGSLNIQVTYRINCDFRVNDSDALISSHFMGMDDHYFRPSLGDTSGQDVPYWSGGKDIGSLPTERRWPKNPPERSQAYGSMSTFHRAGYGAATSPISALRAAGEMNAESPPPSQPQKIPPDHRTTQSSKSSLRSAEGAPSVQRRVSVSFQPFKAGSLSSSPGFGPINPRSPGSIGAGASDISRGLAQARNRTSLTTLPQAALRTPPQPSSEIAVGSPSPNSPKAPPMTRYSSSFGHRRSRLSSGSAGGSRTEEDNSSSVRGSQSSSNQPGSGLLAEGDGGSSGSVQTDEDQIADFLKLLDQKKDLRSFNRLDDASRDASTRRTTAALSKYQRLRESHTALTDSLSSSMMLHRSSSSSSRAPPMLVGNSVSTSSSPGKPISPHTPHYPAIPSRLSANATIEDLESRSGRSQARSSRTRMEPSPGGGTEEVRRADGSTPMDIPTSPQRYPIIRRSSSAAQRRRASEDLDDFGLRSTSLPAEERPDLSMSELLAMQQPLTNMSQPARHTDLMLQSDSRPGSSDMPASSMEESRESGGRGGSTSSNLAPAFRHRLSRGGGRGSPTSFSGGSGESSRVGRYSFTNRPGTADDDEPLVFTMSEIGTQARRSAEDVGGTLHGGSAERNNGGANELGLNRERGSRRGGNLWQ